MLLSNPGTNGTKCLQCRNVLSDLYPSCVDRIVRIPRTNEKPTAASLKQRMSDDRQLNGAVFLRCNAPRHSHVALTSAKHFPRFHVQTHLQQISTDAIRVHFIWHSLKISFSFQRRNPRKTLEPAFQPLLR